jgi:hypothetical protein
MPNNIKRHIAFISIILIFGSACNAQNLFDAGNSYSYGLYLFSAKEYKQAYYEFERAMFLSENPDDSLKCYLVRSLRLSGQPEKAEKLIVKLFPDTIFTNSYAENEYFRILVSTGNTQLLRTVLPKYKFLDKPSIQSYTVTLEILSGNYKAAAGLLEGSNFIGINSPLRQISSEASNMRLKSPALAGWLSFVLPGLGQTYAGNYKDGIFSLLFTGSSAWQSYRGFHQNGISSFYGWAFGGMAAGFYTASIYGAIKAANKRNHQQQHIIIRKLEAYLDNTYL